MKIFEYCGKANKLLFAFPFWDNFTDITSLKPIKPASNGVNHFASVDT